MIRIEASVLSAEYHMLGEQAREAETAGVDGLQIDVMDGRFVPDITFGPGIVRALSRVVDITLDVHLMIVEPEHHLSAFADAGADRLIVHQEACPHLHRTLQTIRELGVEAGVTLNPGTPLSAIEEVLELADAVQVMTVNPGWGGQIFLSDQLDKISRLRRILENRGLDIPIIVDGGIDPQTAPRAVHAGATVLVVGSHIFSKGATVAENVDRLRAAIKD